MKNSEFTELSKLLTKELDSKTKKSEGVFFTPQTIVNATIERVKKENVNIKNILEPSCGSGEFFQVLDSNYTDVNITGIELNKTIYNKMKDTTLENNELRLVNQDYLKWNASQKYDLIVGNPPYFVMKKGEVDERFHDFIEGRPNIFTLFIIHSLQFLEKDGILAFVLPKNFVNCLYYSLLRHHIYEKYKIIDIIHCDGNLFMGTAQDTIIFIIQNTTPSDNHNDQFTMNASTTTLFNSVSNTQRIKELSEGSKTLSELGFDLNIGTVVWNQHKDILTTDKDQTRLIYSGDIKNNKVILTQYKNSEKKNYIRKDGNTGVTMVLNRGYGKGKYSFSYGIVDLNVPYLIENHLINIRYNKDIPKKELMKKYKSLITSFTDKRTNEFVELYFGNNAINITELKTILPIYS
jgi:type I restriction-modification system DNA methylase subunit